MRLAVTGGRDYWDVDTIFLALDTWHNARPVSVLIHGACPTGLDHIADIWATNRGVGEIIREPVDWDKHGDAAGPIRNQLIWDKHHPEALLSFQGNKGTANMVACGLKAGAPVYGVSLLQRKIFRIWPKRDKPFGSAHLFSFKGA